MHTEFTDDKLFIICPDIVHFMDYSIQSITPLKNWFAFKMATYIVKMLVVMVYITGKKYVQLSKKAGLTHKI